MIEIYFLLFHIVSDDIAIYHAHIHTLTYTHTQIHSHTLIYTRILTNWCIC